MKRIVLINVFLLVILTFNVGKACRSKSSDSEEVRERQEKAVDDGDHGEDEEDDETVEDASPDTMEDFDLICDDHVVPNRSQRLPDIIIIGARKGGTRALLEFLKIHPLVKSAGPEIHYFNRHYERGQEWYRQQMVPVEPTQLCAEKTPGYFHTPEVPQRVMATVPDARLLLIVRDPVRRLVSDYNQFRTRNLDRGRDYPPFEDFVLRSDGRIDENYPPLRRSVYHEHFRRWLEVFPKEQIHVVHGDRFITEPWAELQQVEEFLGLPPVITQDDFYFNATKGFFCSQQRRSKGVWECTMRKCLSKSKGRPKLKVDDGVLQKLTDFFRSHNQIFNDLVGRDFGWPT
jgi:hypothetical protein